MNDTTRMNTRMANPPQPLRRSISPATRRSGGLQVGPIGLELVGRSAHRAHPVVRVWVSAGGSADGWQAQSDGARTATGGVGVPGAGHASGTTADIGVGDAAPPQSPSCTARRGTDLGLPRSEVHQAPVACAAGHPGGGGVVRPSPVATRTSTGVPDQGGVLLSEMLCCRSIKR